MPYVHPEYLVETGWVADHLKDSSIRIVESDEDPLLFKIGHIPGAVNIPLGQVAARAADLAAHNRPVVLVCLSDMRSRRAAAQLLHAGLPDLAILQGGTTAWVREGYPVAAGS